MQLPRRFRMKAGAQYLNLVEVAVPPVEIDPAPAHHLLAVDRSGSMYGDIEDLKQTIEQSLAVEAHGNPRVRSTLISFSSQGDCTLHWSGVPVGDLLDLAHPYVTELRSIRATYLTGMSQALDLALQHVDLSETTGITIFTDGYANHPSPGHENRAIEAFVRKASENPRLFVNTVGYRSWCDWSRLNDMANRLSGRCVRARSFLDVLDVMSDTQRLLAGGAQPTVTIPKGEGEFRMAIVGDKVLASRGELKLAGLSKDDEPIVWEVARGDARDIPSITNDSETKWVYGAVAYAALNLGDLRLAKELLFQSGNKSLYEAHKTALTPSAIADLVADLQAWVGQRDNEEYTMGRNMRPKYNLHDLVAAIDTLPSGSLDLDLGRFWRTYTRRTSKRILGSRNAEGHIVPPRATGKLVGSCRIARLAWSGTEASLNVRTVQDLEVVTEGVTLQRMGRITLAGLKSYKDYTLLGSGEWVVRQLPVVPNDKAAWRAIQPFLRSKKANRTFVPGRTYVIQLGDFEMIGTVDRRYFRLVKELPALWTRRKILAAMQTAEVHERFTAEQIEGLKTVHVTPGMNFSPPTTTPWADREQAFRIGYEDTYTRVKALVGTTEVLHSGKIPSANALAKRFLQLERGGVVDKSPKLAAYWEEGAAFTWKGLSARAKPAPTDAVVERALREIVLRKDRWDEESFQREVKRVDRKIKEVEALFLNLVIEIGCTGMVPGHLSGVERLDADQLLKRFPHLKLSGSKTANEKEGAFLLFPEGLLVSVFSSVGEYTTKAGAKALAALAKIQGEEVKG